MNFTDITNRIKNFGKNEATYWGCALAGEVGESCNIIKKLARDGPEATNDKGQKYIDLLPAELADVFIYLGLTARHFNIDLEKSIINKIDILDKNRGFVNAEPYVPVSDDDLWAYGKPCNTCQRGNGTLAQKLGQGKYCWQSCSAWSEYLQRNPERRQS